MSTWLDFACTEDQAEARGEAIAKALRLPKGAGTLYSVNGEWKSAAGLYRNILRIAQETPNDI